MAGRLRVVQRSWLRRAVWLSSLALWLGPAGAQPSAAPAVDPLLTVSKPPASLLPTDPAQGRVYSSPPDLASAEVFFDAAGGPVSLVYIVTDSQGNGYLTFDDGPVQVAPGGVMIVEDLLTRSDKTFDAERDRLLTGRETGLVEPKDLLVLEDSGFLVVADFAGATLSVFDVLGSGDVAPLFVTDNLGSVDANSEPRRPWGLAYDETADRLFVGATDGALLVYDAFLARQGKAGPNRIITLVQGDQAVSHNLHELSYLAARDTVVVTDVGAATTSDQPGFDSDGSLFTVENASRAAGPTPVGLWLHGPATLLGNPVSLAVRNDDVFVAENSLELLLRFDGLLRLQGELELSPNAALSLVRPESVILLEN